MNIAHIKDERIQTTEDHCRETAEIASKFAEDFSASDIGRLSGLLHDAGKLSEAFNLYITGKKKVARGQIDHSFAGARYITEVADSMNANCTDADRYYAISRIVGHIIAAHHGLQDNYDNGTDRFRKRISKDDFYSEIAGKISDIADEATVKNLLKASETEYREIKNRLDTLCKRTNDNKKCNVAYAFYIGLLERLLQSVLIDADRTNTADFMNDTQTNINTDVATLWAEMESRLNRKRESFANKCDRISLQRKNISQRCYEFAANKVGICRLIVPTGGGKTLSSLRFAIEYCKKWKMKKIFYIAPFMSILEQNSDEIRGIAGDENFLEHHSDFLSEIEDENELSEYELHTERWDIPVIATTMVQFLNALFSGKISAVRRMHQLCKSVIIIDEVQSVPQKCINMFNLAMNFLSEICGCTIILCSATQPVFDKVDYPLLLDSNDSMTGDYSEDFNIFKRTDVIPKIEKYGYSYEQAAEFCYHQFCEAGNLLVIVNTKSSALEVYGRLKEKNLSEETVLIHLSTNMCPEHRRERIKEIRDALDQSKPVICVTTQLIEAGVDISFKCVVRSLAGLDNVVQAAGRCNRHGEEDKNCPVYIINIKDENLAKLKEIKESQRVARKIIDSDSYSDYLEVKTLSEYYSLLFKDKNTEMSYKVEYPDTTILDLLSLNMKWHNPCLSKDYCKKNEYSAQAFKTAGKLFEVIDNHTINVIVPYNEDADNIIKELCSEIPADRVNAILRKAQKYTVSIYQNTNKKLNDSNGIYRVPCGAIVLEKEFYCEDFGITTEASEMETLIL
ncbi:MAG: CRISPR-associated helicase Cas3' [Parasporobacterium sp.]|nr:CRISPR-associated helicase Cas3' [Parasporobacterium sp.]